MTESTGCPFECPFRPLRGCCQDRAPTMREIKLELLAEEAFKRPLLADDLRCDDCGVTLTPATATQRAFDVYGGCDDLPADIKVVAHCSRCLQQVMA